MSFHDTFMIFIIITINNVMIIITLCPEATSSCNRCFFNVRCPCQPPHRHQWDTAPSPSPGHVARAWAWRHVSGDTSHVRGGGWLDWTGFYSVLLCSELIHLLLARTGVWVALSLRRLRLSWPDQHQTYGGHQSLPPFITRLANMLDQWTSVHQPRYLDVTVASPCLFIFIQLAWTHTPPPPPPPPPPARRTKSWLKCLN